MSRTWNTAPYEVQKRRRNRGGCRRWPWYLCGGSQEHGRSEWATRFNRQFRRRVRADLHHGREPPQRDARRVKLFIW